MQGRVFKIMQTRSTPLYQQIADRLLVDIRNGISPVGTLLPGEMEFRRTYGTSRHTVREALRVLEYMGVVKRERGRGTQVISIEAKPAFVQMVKDSKELFSYPQDSIFEMLSQGPVLSSQVLPGRLREEISDWARISGIRVSSKGQPICWTDRYVVNKYASIADRLGDSRKPIYELIFETFGAEAERISLELCVGNFSAQKAASLGIAAKTPSLIFIRRCKTGNNRTFEVSVAEHPAESFSFSLEFTRAWRAAEHWSWRK